MAATRSQVALRLDHRDLSILSARDLRTDIETRLAAFARRPSTLPLIRAAVAIVVVDARGEPAVPIFQRTADMRRHAGQMALPGGKMNPGETDEACAMRELEEELGLQVSEADLVGRLDDFETRSGFAITPVVFWSGEPVSALRPSASEVAQLVVVRLGELERAAERAEPGDRFSLRLPTVEVFAPTAAMLYQFSEVALGGREVRVADFYQPPFTHR